VGSWLVAHFHCNVIEHNSPPKASYPELQDCRIESLIKMVQHTPQRQEGMAGNNGTKSSFYTIQLLLQNIYFLLLYNYHSDYRTVSPGLVCLFVCLWRWRGMRPQSKEYPVKRFILISRSDGVVQLYWYNPLPQDFGRATQTHPGGINA
jgi:hypothetical protein